MLEIIYLKSIIDVLNMISEEMHPRRNH